MKLRKEGAISSGMPVAVRHLESMIRMAEAHARMHLRSQVSDTDIDTAVRCTCVQCLPDCTPLHSCLVSAWCIPASGLIVTSGMAGSC